ncbi:MAG TPA: YlxR family protein [Dehalococcoidia bacterium]|nr:YlxR family protein [Dehalococcoidia bacterium]
MSRKNKRVPQRTCIACRQTRNKRDLVRLVCASDGVVELDLLAKKSGRGAYLCSRKDCWERGLKGNSLEHALRTKLSGDNRQSLIDYSNNLP